MFCLIVLSEKGSLEFAGVEGSKARLVYFTQIEGRVLCSCVLEIFGSFLGVVVEGGLAFQPKEFRNIGPLWQCLPLRGDCLLRAKTENKE